MRGPRCPRRGVARSRASCRAAALQQQVDEARNSDGKTQDSMVELGKMISNAAATAPNLLRAAKQKLDEKQAALDDLQAAYNAIKVESDTYKVCRRQRARLRAGLPVLTQRCACSNTTMPRTTPPRA